MGGEAGAESEPNKGSTFYFTAWFNRGQENISVPTAFNAKDLETKLRSHYAGSYILLVEDNAINLEVAQELLIDLNFQVDTADNGKEAIKKVKKTKYDLVLMDVQMPKMDGLEATRQIRALKSRGNLSILAMTAGVLDKEKQACITAGMSDFVAKPIELKNFYSSLIKWLPQISPSQISEPKAIKTESTISLNEQLEHIEGIDASIGLRNLRGNAVSYLRLLRLFDTNHGEDIAKFKHYLSQNKVDEIKKMAHAIKGAAGTLGLTQLQLKAKLLEENLKNHSKTVPDYETTKLLETLTIEHNNFHLALQNIKGVQFFYH